MSALAQTTDGAQHGVANVTTEEAAVLRMLGVDLDSPYAQYGSYALIEAWRLGVQTGIAGAGRSARVAAERAQRVAAAQVLHTLSCGVCGGDDLACPEITGRFLLLGNAAINAARTVTED